MKALAPFFALFAIAGFSRAAHADDSNPPDPSEPTVAMPTKFAPRLSASADGGLAYRAIYGSHIWGGEIAATAGVDLKPGTLLLETDLLYGKTEYGLTTWDWHVAPMWEFRFDRFRAGLGPSLTYLQIARVTTPDHPFHVLGAGVVLQASVDIVQWDATGHDLRPTTPHAFYGALRFNFDDYLEQNDSKATTYGPTFVLGYRY